MKMSISYRIFHLEFVCIVMMYGGGTGDRYNVDVILRLVLPGYNNNGPLPPKSLSDVLITGACTDLCWWKHI